MGDEQSAAFRFRGNLLRETGECFDDRIQRTVHIEVVFFDVVDQRDGGAMVVKRPVELTGFANQDARPARHGAIAGDMCRARPTSPPELRAGGPDDESRIESRLDEYVTKHGGSGALAVCARKTDGSVILLDHTQSLGVGNHVDTPLLSGKQLRMIRLDRRRCDHEVAPSGKFRGGLFVTDWDSFPRQHVRKLT